jgi:hypothetical protein
MGPRGCCVCPKCGTTVAHRPGAPCIEERCPQCGTAMVREGSPHHRAAVEGTYQPGRLGEEES